MQHFPQIYSPAQAMSQQTQQMQAAIAYHNISKHFMEMQKDHFVQQQIDSAMTLYWEPPIPITDYLPTWPLNIPNAPKDLDNIAYILAHQLEMSIWEVFFALVSVIPLAARGCYSVEVTPDWSEPLILYSVLAKESGTRKSKLIEMISQPIRDYEATIQANLDPIAAQFRANILAQAYKAHGKDIAREVHSRCREGNINSDDINALIDRATPQAKLLKGLGACHNGPDTLLLTSIQSAVALEKEMQRQGGALGICTAEDPFADLHLQEKSHAFPQLLQEGHDMKPYLRAKTHHAPVRIDKPALSILAAIQPEVLLTYYAKDHLRDNGFLNRILPCFMGSNYKWVIPREPQVEDDKLRRQYHQKITAILKRCTGPGNPRPRFRLTLSPSAYGQINAYQTYVTSHPTFPDYLKGFVSKHPGNAIRIAACLHLWRHAGTGVAPEDAPINGSDMATAIELCKALLPHAAYAFDTQGRELSKDMQRVLNWIRRHQYRTFTVTDIQHGLSGIKQDKALLIASTLEGYKYLRLVVTPGRATICALNPYFR